MGFVPVGGHPGQLYPSPGSPEFIIKNTSPQELAFYLWLLRTLQVPVQQLQQNAGETLLSVAAVSSKAPDAGESLGLAATAAAADLLGASPSSSYRAGLRPAILDHSNRTGEVAPGDSLALLPLLTPRALYPDTESVREFVRFLPEVKSLRIPHTYALPPLREAADLWHTELGRVRGFEVELRNAVAHMRDPCVMDIKLGTRLYGPDAGPFKKAHTLLKEQHTTQHYGVRLVGFRCTRDEKEVLAAGGNPASTIAAFFDYVRQFVSVGGAKETARVLRQKIEDFRATLERCRIAHFYSSSLLLVYDAAAAATSATVVFVDFNHVDYEGFGSLDTGLLHGLATVLKALELSSDGGDGESEVTAASSSLSSLIP